METHNSERRADLGCSRRPQASSAFSLSFLFLALLLFLSGCASPGEPIERKAPVPEPVKDLAAMQSGNDVVLTFTLPTEALDHRHLDQTPTVEIYRGFPPSASAGTGATFHGPKSSTARYDPRFSG